MDDEKIKIAMMMAASKALDYKKINAKADDDEVLQFVMKEIKANSVAKIGAMAAATKALKYLQETPNAKDKEIMQKVMNESDDILMTMDLE